MAEGGATTSAVKSKPVPPPKPSCSPAKTPTKELTKAVIDTRTTAGGSKEDCTNVTADSDYHDYEEITSNTTKKVTGVSVSPSSHHSELGSVLAQNCEQSSKLSKGIKPPLLPKPRTPLPTSGVNSPSSRVGVVHLPGSLEDSQWLCHKTTSTLTERQNQTSKKLTFSISFRDELSVENGSTRNIQSTSNLVSPLLRKAPVAKLDEFDNLCDPVNPVRPPRSPKIKEFKGGPFAKCNDPKPQLPIKKKFLINSPLAFHGKGTEEARKLDKSKSASLGRSRIVNYSRLKIKSCSLERNNIDCIKQLVESQGSLCNDCTPIPPPRRRRKSDGAQSPDVPLSPSGPVINLQNQLPVYAQVNYNLKKNRRADFRGECSEILNSVCTFQTLAEHDIVESRTIEENPDQSVSLSSGIHDEVTNIVGNSENLCTKLFDKDVEVIKGSLLILAERGGKVADIEENENCSLSCVTESISPGSLIMSSSGTFVEEAVLSNDNVSCGCVSPNVTDEAKPTNNEPTLKLAEESLIDASENKCDVAFSQAEAADDNCDDSLSSSKLEWQSVRSSFRSSSSSSSSGSSSNSDNVLDNLEPKFEGLGDLCETNSMVLEHSKLDLDLQGDSPQVFTNVDCSTKKEVYLHNKQNNVNNCDEQVKDSDNTNIKLDHNNTSVDLNQSINSITQEHQCKKIVSKTCETYLIIEAHKQSPPSLPIECDDNVASSSLGKVRRENYKLLTSSLPSFLPGQFKPNSRLYRRQSWSDSKDCSYNSEQEFFSDWQKCKNAESLWLDEGELSSGTLADIESSDNAARPSSFEEVDVRSSEMDSPHHVGRKFISWWGSFGKSNKKHRVSKRLSHFYCERQGSSGSEDQSSKSGVSGYEGTSSSTMERLSTSLPPILVASPDTREIHDSSSVKKEVMGGAGVADQELENDQHSDSETEDINSSSIVEVANAKLVQQHNEKKVFFIAQELMTSERVFIDVLRLLNINFKQAVEAAGVEQGHPVIPDSDLLRIINSLPQLQRLNEDLLRDLEQRIENWSSIQKIADVIVKKGPFLKLYTTYIQNFEAQCNYFDECCHKYPKFAKVVREFEALPLCQKLSVKHFMLKPVQRIPQYRLLLDDYFRHLNQSSPDYDDTQTALRIVSDVADHANRSIKLGDNLSKLLRLQSQLGNYEIIKPGRIFLKDGELCKLSRKDRQPRYFILLNDCLLYTSYYGSGPSSGLKVNAELSLGGMKVSTPQAEDYHNEFCIISHTRSFTLSARSLSERQEWVDTLQIAIREYTSRQLSFQNQKFNLKRSEGSLERFKLGKEAPVWIQDGRVTKCQSCIAEFTVTFRRHHCRACGKVVCGACSEFRAPLQYMKFQAARVCEECYNALLKEFEDPTTHIRDIIRSELVKGDYSVDSFENIRSHFKKLGPSSGKKYRKYVPQRLLEVTANDSGSHISGWLQRRMKRSWKRFWFVLKEQVLYVYKASEDVAALETIPVLGYKVEPMKKRHFQLYEGVDARFVFQLTHHGELQPLVFSADSEHLANRWIAAMLDATVLK